MYGAVYAIYMFHCLLNIHVSYFVSMQEKNKSEITLCVMQISSFSTNMLNIAAVTEAVKTVMAHALMSIPTQPSWLRTEADIHFGQSRSYITL